MLNDDFQKKTGKDGKEEPQIHRHVTDRYAKRYPLEKENLDG